MDLIVIGVDNDSCIGRIKCRMSRLDVLGLAEYMRVYEIIP